MDPSSTSVRQVNGTQQHKLKPYLIGLSVQTAGHDGDNLGSDEAEVVLLGWAVVDTKTAKVTALHHSYVQPQDLGKVNWELLKTRGINDQEVKSAPSLKDVLDQFHAYTTTLCGEDVNTATEDIFTFVTDGQLPLRQALHPEALKKDLVVPDPYWKFFDIRKEYRKILNNNENLNNLEDIFNLSGLTRSTSTPEVFRECHDLGTVIERLVSECKIKGLECFGEEDTIRKHLQHGVCTKGDHIDPMTIVRARGLPWQSSDQDVARFFIGLNISRGGVALCLSNMGRRNGEALVHFESQEHRDMALRRHRHFMGNRYIEIYRATAEDFVSVAAGSNDEVQSFLSQGTAIVRMRGLPYDCTSEQILEFFASAVGGTEPVTVQNDQDGILFVNKADGKATGDAFVLFESLEGCATALKKHKQSIGSRYIELFQSTHAEVAQVINQQMEPKTEPTPATTPGLMAAVPSMPLGSSAGIMQQPQALLISGNRKDCVRLRGLPYEAQVQHILDFLGELAKHIVFQGVHMVYNPQGHPSGEAFIQMDSEQASAATALDRHNKYMQMGKKQRYIEVFQCSADDMNLCLTGPTAAAANVPNGPFAPGMQAANQLRPLISPGSMLANGALSPTAMSAAMLNPQLLAGQFQNGGVPAGFAQHAAFPGLFNQSAPAARMNPAFMPAAMNGMLPVVSMANGGNGLAYWPYPSPPVSPTNYYAALAQQNQAAVLAQLAMTPAVILMRGLNFNSSVQDVLNFFQGFDIPVECVQMQRAANGQQTGDALVSFANRMEAERALLEKNRQPFAGRVVELYLCT